MKAENRGALGTFLQTAWFDFPLAVQKWTLGSDSHEVEEVLLKACQQWTNLANQAIERVFEAEGFVGLMTASVKQVGQWQRVTREFMESMQSDGGKGKSEGNEIGEMRETVSRLRQEVRTLTAKVNLLSAGNELALGASKDEREETASQ